MTSFTSCAVPSAVSLRTSRFSAWFSLSVAPLDGVFHFTVFTIIYLILSVDNAHG